MRDGVRAVLFDLDGVILQTAAVHMAAWQQLFDEVVADRPYDPVSDYHRYLDGRRRIDGVRSFLASRGIRIPDGRADDPPRALTVHGLGNRKNAYFKQALDQVGVRVWPDAVELLDALAPTGIPVAVVSASEHSSDLLQRVDLLGRFDTVVGGREAARLGLPGKPDPATFRHAAAALGAQPASAIVLEDAVSGVQSARAGGFGRVIGVDRGRSAEALLAAGADEVLGDLRDLIHALHLPTWVAGGVDALIVSCPEVPAGLGDPVAVLQELGSGAQVVVVGPRVELPGLPAGVRAHHVDPHPRCAAAAEEIAKLRRLLPRPRLDPEWTISHRWHAGTDSAAAWRRSVFTLADTRFSTSGALEEEAEDYPPAVLQAGVFDESVDPPTVLVRPPWSAMALTHTTAVHGVHLDLRNGVLYRVSGPVRTVRFAPLQQPGTFVQHTEAPAGTITADDPPEGPVRQRSELVRGRSIVHRTAGYAGTAQRAAADLLAGHRAAWRQRWAEARIGIEGEPDLERAIRFGLFHLLASVPDEGESALGARGMTGLAYRGHVFWDSDVFMLPFFAGTRPQQAAAILRYRSNRLAAARQNARAHGHRGARFPWESARSGFDVTPHFDRPTAGGPPIRIRTGDLEEHITSDVAWAALHYTAWTGSPGFRELIVQTARYWASRVTDGHIDDVIGPDEYHEGVEDNAYTNVLVRWHLREAAAMVGEPESQQWRSIADSLVDGYDPATGVYEQFRGYHGLEELRVEDLGPPPLAADLVFGRERIRHSQIIKQPDVLMLHHLLPQEVAPGSLLPNLEHYLPRCSHGSSLSPAIHAGLLARAGRLPEAVSMLRMACRIDLEDITRTTHGGLHLGTYGGIWQALVFGFLGVRPGFALTIDPVVPSSWGLTVVHLRFHGVPLRLWARGDRFGLWCGGPLLVRTPGAEPRRLGAGRHEWERTGPGWAPVTSAPGSAGRADGRAAGPPGSR